uniref:Uncharacterized protein n=1 Tax=Oryza nivara TaxID=4536 RepID=A0A0E0G1F8_ORYNI
MQKEEGMYPVKLLLLALMTTRFLIFSHVVDGKSPVNRLLEMFSTCSGQSHTDEFNSCTSLPRRLKQTSRTMMLLEDISSTGRPPESELYDRLRRDKLVSSPRDGEICPSRPLEDSSSSVTAPSMLQMIPSQVQQSVLFLHDMVRLLSCESPARKWRRELCSCSVHELTGVTRVSNSKTRARPNKCMQKLLLLLLLEEWSIGFMPPTPTPTPKPTGASATLKTSLAMALLPAEPPPPPSTHEWPYVVVPNRRRRPKREGLRPQRCTAYNRTLCFF